MVQFRGVLASRDRGLVTIHFEKLISVTHPLSNTIPRNLFFSSDVSFD